MKEEFDSDLERFEVQMQRELNSGLAKMKESVEEQEVRLRNDLHSAVGGWISYMKSKYGTAVILTLFISTGCNPPTSPDIDVDVNLNIPISLGGTPDGNTGGACPAVARVNISEFPSTLDVGDQERIDVTPKTSTGQPRDPDCDIASGVSWDSNDSICSVGDDEEFVTFIRGVSPGTCTIEACVENICDTESFPVS